MFTSVKNVTRYGYRSANVNNRFMVIPREWVQALENELCHITNSHSDNHVTFEFEFDSDYGFNTFTIEEKYMRGKIVVLFHDWVAIFGTEVEVKNW